MMLRGKSKKGYKISGNRNLFSVRYWSKSEDMRMWDVARSDAARSYLAMRNGSWEELKERYRKEEKSSEWTLERVREAHEKVAKDEIGHCA